MRERGVGGLVGSAARRHRRTRQACTRAPEGFGIGSAGPLTLRDGADRSDTRPTTRAGQSAGHRVSGAD